MMNSPFRPGNEAQYARWREHKLALSPSSAQALMVEIRNPCALSATERHALMERIERCNMAIYASPFLDDDSSLLRKFGAQLGLHRLDVNWLAGEDGLSAIQVSRDDTRQHYIPYTDKPIKWHTDGYYNPPGREVRAMMLHCVRSAVKGGENHLMDHEMAYLLLRDQNPQHIHALMQPDAMTIPERVDETDGTRPLQSGPVFSLDTNGHLHMRYTARTRSIAWKQDAATQAAVRALEHLLASDSPFIYRVRLEPGMGIVCNNVLHSRSAFTDDPASPRLLYRARYRDRITL